MGKRLGADHLGDDLVGSYQLLQPAGDDYATRFGEIMEDEDQRLSERPNRSSIRDCRNSSPIESSQ